MTSHTVTGAPYYNEWLNISPACRLKNDKYETFSKMLRINNKECGISKALREYDIDVIMGAPLARLGVVAGIAGCPMGTVPLTDDPFSGHPIGIGIIAQAGREDLVLKTMSS